MGDQAMKGFWCSAMVCVIIRPLLGRKNICQTQWHIYRSPCVSVSVSVSVGVGVSVSVSVSVCARVCV